MTVTKGKEDESSVNLRKLSPEDEECKRRLLAPLNEKQMRLFRMQLHLRLVPLFIIPPAICAGIVESIISGRANVPNDLARILVAIAISLASGVLFSVASAGLLIKIETKERAELNWGNVCFAILSLNSVSFTGYFVLLWIILKLVDFKLGVTTATVVAFVLMAVSTVSVAYFLRKRLDHK